MAERARLEIACGSKAHRGFESPPLRVYNLGQDQRLWNRLGQHQSQWILMKDAALDKDPQSIIFKVFTLIVKGSGMREKEVEKKGQDQRLWNRLIF